MNIKNLFKLISLIVGFSASLWLTFSLLANWTYGLLFFEPKLFVRIIEVTMGLISIPFLAKMIYDLMKKVIYEKRD